MRFCVSLVSLFLLSSFVAPKAFSEDQIVLSELFDIPEHIEQEVRERVRREGDLASIPELLPVVRMRHVIEPDHRRLARVGRAERDRAATF